MSVFDVAVDDLFSDSELAHDAVYRAAGAGDGTIVRVILRRPDRVLDFGDTRVHAPMSLIDLRVAEVAAPRPGDTIELEGESFVVQGEPVRDGARLVWTLDTRPA